MNIYKKILIGCSLASLVLYGSAFSDNKSHHKEEQPPLVNVGQIINGFKVIKYIQHKGHPSQVPMGTPVALVVIGYVIIFVSPNNLPPTEVEIFAMEDTLKILTKTKFKETSKVNCQAETHLNHNEMRCTAIIVSPQYHPK